MAEAEKPPDGPVHEAEAPLPRDVQEHLGRQLRSAYNEVAERPAFLGDTTVPPQFEKLIRRMEIGERLHDFGVDAVRQALKIEPDAHSKPRDGEPRD